MEIADFFVLNKSDRPGADSAIMALKTILMLRDHDEKSWLPNIIKSIASENSGTKEIADEIDRHHQFLDQNGLLKTKREANYKVRIKEIVEHLLKNELWKDDRAGNLEASLAKVVEGETSPYQIAESLFNDFKLTIKKQVFMIESSLENSFLIEFDENQLAIKNTIRAFAEEKIKPCVMEFDESQKFPMELMKQLGDLGFLGILVPEKFGGSELGYVEYALIVEELARIDPSIALSVAAHNGLCTNHINVFANDEQKNKYLPDLASGRKIGAWGLTEPGSGSDAAAMQTTAVKDGEFYILNGTKAFITHGGVGETVVVLAVTDKSKNKKGISAFIVEKGTEGFSTGKKENKLGMRSSETTQLIFENCHVPANNLMGNEGEGFTQAMRILEGGRISIAALSVGLAQGCLEASLAYSKERKQFGKSISEFQAIQFKLADLATEIEAARLMTFKAARMKDQNKNILDIAAKAKLFASEVATRAANEAVQIFGGYGFTKDYPVEKFYRDVKLLTIGEGTSEVQRIVIARTLLQDQKNRWNADHYDYL